MDPGAGDALVNTDDLSGSLGDFGAADDSSDMI
jgi:hypothetical protein